MSFDCLYSAVMISNAFLYERNNQLSEFSACFIFEKFDSLLHYLRYVMIQIPFSGFATKLTIQEILFGYRNDLLTVLSTMDPALGGDPSINPYVGLNVNQTKQMAQPQRMKTGKNSTSLVRKFSTVNYLPYITIAQQMFNGNETQTIYVNPWKIDDMVSRGTDAFCFSPDVQEGESLGIVVTDLVRSANLEYVEKEDFFGLEALHYKVGEDFYAVNDTWHNNRWKGLVNFTSV